MRHAYLGLLALAFVHLGLDDVQPQEFSNGFRKRQHLLLEHLHGRVLHFPVHLLILGLAWLRGSGKELIIGET